MKLTDYDIQGYALENTSVCKIRSNNSLQNLRIKSITLFREQVISSTGLQEQIISVVQGHGKISIDSANSVPIMSGDLLLIPLGSLYHITNDGGMNLMYNIITCGEN